MDDNQVVEFNDKYLFSLSQLSSVFGPARETITKRLRLAGVFPGGKRNNHDVYPIGPAARAIILGDQQGIGWGDIKDPELLPPKERLDYFKSENERLKYEREVGLVVSVEEAQKEQANIIKTVARALDTLPDILERDCDLSTDVVAHVESVIDKVREELAQELSE